MCNVHLQGIMGVFMREPLLDWQREARVVTAKRSAGGTAKEPVSAADTIDPQDMHVNLKVPCYACCSCNRLLMHVGVVTLRVMLMTQSWHVTAH